MHIAQVETVDRNFQRKTRSAHNKKNHAFFFHGNNNYNEEDFLTYPLQSICLYREEKTQEQDKQSKDQRSKGSQASREGKNWNSGASKSRVYNRSKNQVERADVHLANT